MIRFFRVISPTVHEMVLGLEKARLISRKPGVARGIAVPLDRSDLPALSPHDGQPVKTTVTEYSHMVAVACSAGRVIRQRSLAIDEEIIGFRISGNLLLTLCRYIEPHTRRFATRQKPDDRGAAAFNVTRQPHGHA